MIKIKLIKFYGFSEEYIYTLKLRKVNEYLQGIDILITEESERIIDYMRFCHVSDEEREKIVNKYCWHTGQNKQVDKSDEVVEMMTNKERNDKKRVSLKLFAAAFGSHA